MQEHDDGRLCYDAPRLAWRQSFCLVGLDNFDQPTFMQDDCPTAGAKDGVKHLINNFGRI